ncbi:DUF3566 domain-containing protein [Amycolatopsis sp. H20-H5]|uniref:DUF3566 domain-containing protein n=1 Tax=Amycolatopsis sp. H20-H5 TaxID=3046309 RepID=UPI002DBDF533|nr:DUF3566 domain-containing protein [Amycolatopsis sp. H20-H5]MEC3974606.1 DUF3566 domain-containing protein [Amycolatopsis sp. H20-H5]
MTPSEKPEAQSPKGGATAGSASPPWQRDGKDGGAAGETDAGRGTPVDQLAASSVATDEVAPADHEQDGRRVSDREYHPGTGDYPAVSGTAARRLFGDSGEPETGTPQAGAAPASATRGRPTPTALRRPGRGPRRASLQIKRFDPWSVLKLSLVLSVAMFFVWLVAVGVLYTVLDGMGVWDKLNGTYSSLVGGEGGNASADPLISAGRVFGIAAILGAINIVLVSALSTVSAFIYNVSADLAGGLEVTLSERE